MLKRNPTGKGYTSLQACEVMPGGPGSPERPVVPGDPAQYKCHKKGCAEEASP